MVPSAIHGRMRCRHGVPCEASHSRVMTPSRMNRPVTLGSHRYPGLCRPDGGNRSQPDREHVLEQESQEEHWHRDTDQRKNNGAVVHHAAAALGCHIPERDAEAPARGSLPPIVSSTVAPNRVIEHINRRSVPGETRGGLAEVSLKHPAEKLEILNEDRLVQTRERQFSSSRFSGVARSPSNAVTGPPGRLRSQRNSNNDNTNMTTRTNCNNLRIGVSEHRACPLDQRVDSRLRPLWINFARADQRSPGLGG